MQVIETEVARCTLAATVKQSELKAALARVAHAVSTRSTLSILSNILIATEGDHLRISATNLEIAMSVTVAGYVTEQGSTTIPAKLFTDYINSLGTGEVELAPLLGGMQGLRVRSGTRESNIRGMSPDEFPRMPDTSESQHIFTIDAVTLRSMIRSTAIAFARDDERPIFTAILTTIKDDLLTMVSADTFRLAMHNTTLTGAAHFDDLLVPGTTYETLASVLPTSGTVDVALGKNQIFFSMPDLLLGSRLIDGTYAVWQAIVPPNFATRVVMPTERLKEVIGSTSLFAKSESASNTVRISVTPGQDGLTPGVVTMVATNDEMGDSTGTVDATVDGPAVTILFNVKYVAQALATIDTPEVVLELNSAQSPGRMSPMGYTSTCAHILMPLYSRG